MSYPPNHQDFIECVKFNNVEKVEQYLENAGDDLEKYLELETNDKKILFLASSYDAWDVVLKFIEFGADLDIHQFDTNWSFAHEAASKETPFNVFKNVMPYVDLSVQTRTGKTPLMIAIEASPEKALFILKNIPINDNALMLLDAKGKSALDYAMQKNHQETIELLKQMMDNKETQSMLVNKESNDNNPTVITNNEVEAEKALSKQEAAGLSTITKKIKSRI